MIQEKGIKKVKHFGLIFDLPPTATLSEYISLKAKKDKKNKTKFTKFSYYKTKDGKVLKVIFLPQEKYVEIGSYPFTDPTTIVKDTKQLGDLNPERLVITQAAYIGHQDDNRIYVKKMIDIKLQEGKIELETADDNFQYLRIGNHERFNQFLKIMKVNPKSNEMSVRIMIDQSDPEKPQIIDYEFFFREEELKKSKNLIQLL